MGHRESDKTAGSRGVGTGSPEAEAARVAMPPRTTTADGRDRRIGVELEFAAMSANAGAQLVRSLFGGTIEEEDPHRYHITKTRLGDFTSELDTQFAHRAVGEPMRSELPSESLAQLLAEFRDEFRRVYGDVSSLVVPCEIVCPPIAMSNLFELDRLVEALTQAGAQGTRASPFFAFGSQLNPEIATQDADWLVAVFKAYLLMSDWLRAVMAIDPTRQLTAFADPFPMHYAMKVVDPGYWPRLGEFIDDYVDHNPTRNRELDMLPLFAWLDRDRVHRSITDSRIKPRPTFHYRLPDANFGEPGWTLGLEWRRWLVVERLAEHPEKLNAMGAAFVANQGRLLPDNWAIRSSEWLILP